MIHAPFIRKNDGALKVAARKLKELSVVEGSLLAQGRRAASRLAGWRVQQQRALTEPTTNHAVDEVAAFARDLLDIAVQPPAVHAGADLSEDEKAQLKSEAIEHLLVMRAHARRDGE